MMTSRTNAPAETVVSVVIVSWNTCALLRACLESVEVAAQQMTGRVQTIVIDNASADETVETVRREYPWVTVLTNSANRGFAAATNQGVRLSTGRYVLLLNPDTEVSPQSLAQLVKFMDSRREAAAVGPRVVGGNGLLQESCFPLPTLGRELWRLFGLDTLRRLASYPLQQWQTSGVHPVEAIQGSCLLVRRSTLVALGALDEQFFIYTEEVDLCRRMKDAGWSLFWLPEASIVHLGGQSTRQAGPRMFLELYRSKVQYFRKHMGSRTTRLYKALLAAAAIPRIVLPALVLIAQPARRAELQTLIGNYWSLLRALPGLETSPKGLASVSFRNAIGHGQQSLEIDGAADPPVRRQSAASSCAVVVVSRDNGESLKRCLGSLDEARTHNLLEVVVVDNGSTDGSLQMLQSLFPDVRVVRNERDIGLGPASNQGIEATQSPYILLLSSDAVVDGKSLDTLIEFMAATPEAGAAGGTLLDENGSFHAAFNRFSSLTEELLIATRIGEMLWVGYPSHHTDTQIRPVDWLCSACLLVRRSALLNVGLLEERFVTYGDEADFQYRLVRGGWKVYYLPQATTIVHGNGSADRWRRRKMVYRGKMLFYKWNYGPAREVALRAMLGAVTLAKVAAWCLLWPVPQLHDRAMRELRSNTEVLRLCVRLE
jgi:GT2 family glycosyltransferase